MNGIRFSQKTETDGRQTLHVEISENATREDLDNAWRDVVVWLIERGEQRSRFFSSIRHQAEFDFQVHRLLVRGYSPARIAQRANAELLDLLRRYQVERSKLNLAGDTATVSLIRVIYASTWWSQCDSILSVARPGWTAEKRREDINAACDALKLGNADSQCLIDTETIRRSNDRYLERIEGKISPRRKGRVFKNLR